MMDALIYDFSKDPTTIKFFLIFKTALTQILKSRAIRVLEQKAPHIIRDGYDLLNVGDMLLIWRSYIVVYENYTVTSEIFSVQPTDMPITPTPTQIMPTETVTEPFNYGNKTFIHCHYRNAMIT